MHKLDCLLTLGRIGITLQTPTPNAVMLCLISLFVSFVHRCVKITAPTPCGAAVTYQTAVRFHSQSQGMVERVNGTFKKLTTILRNRVPKPKDEPPRRVEPGDQVYLRVFRRKWNEPRREGPYKVTNARHRGGREFPISWSSALVSGRILYLIYLNDELLNVPLWVMFVIALYCLDSDVLCCFRMIALIMRLLNFFGAIGICSDYWYGRVDEWIHGRGTHGFVLVTLSCEPCPCPAGWTLNSWTVRPEVGYGNGS